MEATITIKVKVNDEEHATLIRNDLMNAVTRRTTLYYVSDIDYNSDKSIKEEQLEHNPALKILRS